MCRMSYAHRQEVQTDKGDVMSYHWSMTSCNIEIKNGNFGEIRRAALRDGCKIKAPTDEKFMRELFDDHGFIAFFDDGGDLIDITQRGERLDDQEKLLRMVTPFCEGECYVCASGENDELWRWELSSTNGFSHQNGIVVYEPSICPMKEAVELCTACPFSLVCNTSSETVLKGAQCGACGGTMVIKDDMLVLPEGEDTGPLAAITCTCLKRKFDVKKPEQEKVSNV